ncbi:hypothetical protein B0T16DRAFT_154954 [Cercophora newfieldiana]|uniref:Uncharacterized protein n=1 Tax=Cercophora newfieldiana TaxID=92897 RepID=A0AA40CPS0_9PEZI|nr:hypothetical protein B0T16DRAFT_154954 [Cercophora newfieldiana]
MASIKFSPRVQTEGSRCRRSWTLRLRRKFKRETLMVWLGSDSSDTGVCMCVCVCLSMSRPRFVLASSGFTGTPLVAIIFPSGTGWYGMVHLLELSKSNMHASMGVFVLVLFYSFLMHGQHIDHEG